jgi:fructosamine-3-kinase
VREIRNLAVSQLNNVAINVINEVDTPEDAKKFRDGLISFLKEHQEFGREVAKTIAKDSYANGFKIKWYEYYQYHYFGNMLEYIQNNYFNSTQITIFPKLADAIHTALKVCVKRYVDYHCITVY